MQHFKFINWWIGDFVFLQIALLEPFFIPFGKLIRFPELNQILLSVKNKSELLHCSQNLLLQSTKQICKRQFRLSQYTITIWVRISYLYLLPINGSVQAHKLKVIFIQIEIEIDWINKVTTDCQRFANFASKIVLLNNWCTKHVNLTKK